ncbi:hypothetical protein [Magnetospirillum molischianum]|uniref:Uncharacterized protein n=1 Tax=Magnetospirillum molischianum DSM 120 TaxID=1150626 RepID=H8FW70_MAGML|nr:hypothetical protein [Magnetospirillum molischianum]CCG42608.1 conserved exported hypothetical protein [Magnetospirillum molischianum DSM 120]
MLRPLLAVLSLIIALPAAAEPSPRPFDIGLAQIGMRLNQLRFAAFPANTRLVCSQDQERPNGADRTPLALPSAMVAARVNRCALFTDAGKDNWVQRQVILAGAPTDFWFMAIEDETGAERIFQMTGRQPREAFDKTAAALIERWGPPALKTPHYIRWINGSIEAQMADDNEGTVLFLMDTKMHQLLDSRLPKPKPKKEKKE